MILISAVIIARNEEDMIADCLDSVSFCDEVLVVDNGSLDNTREIAERTGAKVFELETEDFSKLRNYGLQKAMGKWILYVDADERVTGELKKAIMYLTGNNDRGQQLNGYFVKRKNFYFGSAKQNEWPHIERIERLFKKDSLKGWKGKIHESPIVDGEIGSLDGFLLHYTHRNLTSMLEKTIEWSKIEAELRFKSGHPKMRWWRFSRVMLVAFFDSYIRQGGWKVGTIGLIEGMYQSFSIFVTYSRLWEMQKKNEK